jgi:hypothetical protein
VQRPPQLAARERAVGLLGARPGAGGVDGADGVQRRVMALNSRKVETGELGGRETARADSPGKLGSAGERIDALV